MSPKPVWILVALLGLAGCDKHEHGAAHENGSPHEHAHAHEHGDPDKAAASLTLDDGKKWPTDDSLRTGMTAIRDRLQAAMGPIHANTFSGGDYEGLASAIDKEIGTIVASCKLPRNADDQLHLVLVQVTAGTAAMKKDGDRMGGAVKVMRALESYDQFFDHPGWKPLEH